jgi:hypothetical protein
MTDEDAASTVTDLKRVPIDKTKRVERAGESQTRNMRATVSQIASQPVLPAPTTPAEPKIFQLRGRVLGPTTSTLLPFARLAIIKFSQALQARFK